MLSGVRCLGPEPCCRSADETALRLPSDTRWTSAVAFGDVDGDGKIEVVYDHAGCDAARGPIYVVEPLTGKIKAKVDYRRQGVRHAQNIALGNFDKTDNGLEIAFCEKGSNIYLFDAESGALLDALEDMLDYLEPFFEVPIDRDCDVCHSATIPAPQRSQPGPAGIPMRVAWRRSAGGSTCVPLKVTSCKP